VLALIGALCYAELGARRPQAGGAYVYLREAYGPMIAFVYGWIMLVVNYSGSEGGRQRDVRDLLLQRVRAARNLGASRSRSARSCC
jgi:hypothetical protein